PAEPALPLFRPVTGWRALWRGIPWLLVSERAGLVALAALVTGMLYPLNTWDFPTYVLVTAAAFVLLEALASREAAGDAGEPRERHAWRLSFAALRRAGIWALGTVL
ncbi:MAG: hypothetical protein C4289_08600, partial [Chloroflexota bacterium]